jgi:hypothetical protein
LPDIMAGLVNPVESKTDATKAEAARIHRARITPNHCRSRRRAEQPVSLARCGKATFREPASMLAPGAPQSPASRLSVWARAGWREDAHQGVWQNEKKWTFGCARGPRKPLPKPSPLPGARFPWRGAQRRPATRHPAHQKINRQRRMLENIRDRLPAHAPTKDPSVAER